MKILLLALLALPLILAGCNAPTSDELIKWEININDAASLNCTNPDLLSFEEQTCIWYCRDFKGEKNVDVIVVLDRDALKPNYHLELKPSEKCNAKNLYVSKIRDEEMKAFEEMMNARVEKMKAAGKLTPEATIKK